MLSFCIELSSSTVVMAFVVCAPVTSFSFSLSWFLSFIVLIAVSGALKGKRCCEALLNLAIPFSYYPCERSVVAFHRNSQELSQLNIYHKLHLPPSPLLPTLSLSLSTPLFSISVSFLVFFIFTNSLSMGLVEKKPISVDESVELAPKVHIAGYFSCFAYSVCPRLGIK